MNIKERIIRALEHNEQHYIELNIFGRTIRPCARCFGKFIGIIFSFILALPFVFGFIDLKIGFLPAFILSWSLAIPAIVDWSSVKLGIREGSNKTRFVTGFLLGCGITTYLIIMPASLLFKVVTFMIYEFVFALIYIHTKVGLKNAISTTTNQIKANPRPYIYSCECGWGCCCPCADGCYGGCMNAMLCVTLVFLSIPFFYIIGKGGCGMFDKSKNKGGD